MSNSDWTPKPFLGITKADTKAITAAVDSFIAGLLLHGPIQSVSNVRITMPDHRLNAAVDSYWRGVFGGERQ